MTLKYMPTEKKKVIKRFFYSRQLMPQLKIYDFAVGAGIKPVTFYLWLKDYKKEFRF